MPGGGASTGEGAARDAIVWLDGRLLPRAEARVSVDDLGFLYGAACFETMRARGGAVFRLYRHLDRLARGLALLGVEPPDRAALCRALAATLEANALPDARLRLTVSAGQGSGRPDLAAAEAPTVLVVAEPAAAPPAAARLAVASARLDERSPLRAAKTANYLPFLLARAEARAAGAGEALLLNSRGEVAEASTANLFAVVGGRLLTPPLEAGSLPGVTREAVLECARALGLAVEERALPLALLGQAAEVFLTNSVAGVWPVAEIAGAGAPWRAAAAPGPLTARLAAAYAALVETERVEVARSGGSSRRS